MVNLYVGPADAQRLMPPHPDVNPGFTELQEAEFRKVDANLLDRNQRRIASLVETGTVKKRDRDYRPAAGTVWSCRT